jgi:hypothetical protein
VQVWRLYTDEVGPRNPARGRTGVHARMPHPETLAGDCSAGCRYDLRDLDPAQVGRLALIVVRLDPHEATDPVGAYRLVVGSTPSGS